MTGENPRSLCSETRNRDSHKSLGFPPRRCRLNEWFKVIYQADCFLQALGVTDVFNQSLYTRRQVFIVLRRHRKGQVKSNREEHEEVMKKHDDSSKRQPPRGSAFVQPPPLSITGLAGLLSPIVELIK